MTIKLVIADVDGTMLTRAKVLTPGTVEAVEKLRARGIAFTLTSGRPPRGMRSMVAALKLTAPLAAFNGGMYVMPDLTTVIAQRTIAHAVARQAVGTLLDAGLDVWIYQGSDWFIRNPDAPRVARERSNVGFDPIVIDDLLAVVETPVKIVGVSQDHALVARCEAELGANLGAEVSAARSQADYLDVTHPEANKGMVVREAARLLQISIDEVATIGDMLNDVPMLKIAGCGIAMGNASLEVQRVARHVTRSNEDEGFAHAVDAFILGEPPITKTNLGLPPRTRACVFGLEGVLTQIDGLAARAWKTLFDPYLRSRAQTAGTPFVPFDALRDYIRYFDGKAHPYDLLSFLASRGIELPEPTLHALAERHQELLLELFRHERVEIFDGAVRYVRQAHAAGLRTAVVSSSKYCDEELEAAGIADLFDARIDGWHALPGGPGPDAYLAALKALGVDSEEAVIFEDELAGVEAARQSHVGYIVGVNRLGRADELRSHGADVVVTELTALFGPGGGELPPPAA